MSKQMDKTVMAVPLESTEDLGLAPDHDVRPGFYEWHGGRYAGAQLEIAEAAWDAAISMCLEVLGDEHTAAVIGQCARDPDTGGEYFDNRVLKAVESCLGECMDKISGPDAM